MTDASEPAAAPEPVPNATPRPRWWRRPAYLVALVVVIVAPLCGRAALEGRAEIRRADAAREAGDIDTEILHLGRAARWRTPGLSHDEDARARLLEIGRQAQAEGDASEHVALAAFREVRRALLATRTLSVADPEQLHEANEHIADLMAAQETRFETDVGGSGDPRSWHLQQLQQMPGPTPWRATAAAVCFVLWLVATGGFVLRGLDAAGRLRPRPAVRWGVASLVLLVGWAWMLAG